MTARRWLPVLAGFFLSMALPACGPISVNTVAVSSHGKLAFAVDPELNYSFLPESPRWDIILTDASGASLKRITANGRHNSWATFSPDGRTLLCMECTVLKEEKKEAQPLFQKIIMYDVATGERRLLRGDKDIDFLLFPQFSPDCKKVAYLTGAHLKVVSVQDGSLVASWPRFSDEAPGVLGFRWVVKDGLFVVWGNEELAGADAFPATIGIVTVAGEKQARSPVWQGRSSEGITWAVPWITARRGTAVIPLYDLKLAAKDDDIARAPFGLWVHSNGSLRKLTGDGRSYYFPEISPDGRRVAAVSTQVPAKGEEAEADEDADADSIPLSGDLVLLDIATGKVKTASEGACAHPFWIDDERLGFVRGDPTTEKNQIVVLNLRTGKRFNLTQALAPRLKKLFARGGGRAAAD